MEIYLDTFYTTPVIFNITQRQWLKNAANKSNVKAGLFGAPSLPTTLSEVAIGYGKTKESF